MDDASSKQKTAELRLLTNRKCMGIVVSGRCFRGDCRARGTRFLGEDRKRFDGGMKHGCRPLSRSVEWPRHYRFVSTISSPLALPLAQLTANSESYRSLPTTLARTNKRSKGFYRERQQPLRPKTHESRCVEHITSLLLFPEVL